MGIFILFFYLVYNTLGNTKYLFVMIYIVKAPNRIRALLCYVPHKHIGRHSPCPKEFAIQSFKNIYMLTKALIQQGTYVQRPMDFSGTIHNAQSYVCASVLC